MIITCTECKKRFEVPDNAIPVEGRVVQCSSCSNEWKQFPVKKPEIVKKTTAFSAKKTTQPIKKKIVKKSKGPVPYSKEYMQEKWGGTVQSYAAQKGLSKNPKALAKAKTSKKTQKQKSTQVMEKPGFGFFNYIITYSVIFIFLIGILKFERGRLGRKFPALEPYIDHFFESLEIFKILILDFLES